MMIVVNILKSAAVPRPVGVRDSILRQFLSGPLSQHV